MNFLRSLKTPAQIIIFFAISIPLLYLGFCFPEVRASFYPVSACFSKAGQLSIHPYSATFATNETPVFVISTESGHFYDCALYAKDDLLKSIKAEKNQLASISPYPELSKADLLKIMGPVLFKEKGVFIPLDEHHAEAKVRISKKLKPGDYVAVFRSKSVFGENLDLAIARFRVTNIGALVKIDDYKAVVVVFDLITREIVRDVTVRVYLRKKDDDSALRLVSSLNSGHNDLIELDLIELLKGESDVKERLVIDFSKANHSAFFGDIKYSGDSDFSIPLNVLSPNRHHQKHPKNRTFISLNCRDKVLNYFGQLTVCTEAGIKLTEKAEAFYFEIISPTRGVLLKEKIITDNSGAFSGSHKLKADMNEEGLKLIISSDSFDDEVFDISKSASQSNIKAAKTANKLDNRFFRNHSHDDGQTDESWFREFDSQSIQIDFDKTIYNRDDSLAATVKLSPEIKFPFFLVSLEGEKIFKSKLIHVQSNPVKVSFKLGDETKPNVYFGLATVQKEHSPKALVKEIEMSLVGKKLEFQVEATEDDSEARKLAKVKVHVKDSEGKPVSGAKIFASLPERKALFVVSRSEGFSPFPGNGKKFFETLYAPLANNVTTVYTATAAENQSFTKYKRFDFWGRTPVSSNQMKPLPEMKNRSPLTGDHFKPESDTKVEDKSTLSSTSTPLDCGAFLTSVSDENGEANFNFQIAKEDKEKVLTIFGIDDKVRVGSFEKVLSAVF